MQAILFLFQDLTLREQRVYAVRYTQHSVCVCVIYSTTRNDPSAGSPTDALLRLLFPLDHTVRLSFHRSFYSKNGAEVIPSPSNSQRSPSVRATGGVYKGQGRIPGGLLNQRPVQGIPS